MKNVIALALVVALAFACDPQFSDGCTTEFFPGPAFPAGDLGQYVTSDFNVITFGDFAKGALQGGDVEGRLLVGNNVVPPLEAFSVGERLRTGGAQPADNARPFAMVVNGDASFGGGHIYPDGTGNPCPSGGAVEKLGYVADAGIVDYISREVITKTDLTPIKDHFVALAATFAGTTTNADVTLNQLGLSLNTATPGASRYYAQISTSDFNAGFYWTLGVNFPANVEVILTIVDDGSGPVVFSGGKFAPSTTGRTVFNIPGDRVVKVEAMAVEGHILAPESTFEQKGGYVKGFVVVNEVAEFLQVNKPECPVTCQCCGLCNP